MKATISGSFKKFYQEICSAYEIFERNGIVVLSPSKSRIINPGAEFALLESDPKGASNKELEDRHLEAIANSDFLYVVSPNGYAGKSAVFEMGHANALRRPIYCSDSINDVTLEMYVKGAFAPESLIIHLKNQKKL